MGKDPDQIRQEIESTRERMGDTVEAIAYKADVPSRVRDNISDRVEGVKSAVGNTIGRIGSAVTGTTSAVGSNIGDAATSSGRVLGRGVGMVKDNPLGLLFSGVALGFLLGSVLPRTQLENERIGELSDNLKEQAQSIGEQALEHGKAVVRETVSAAQNAAQDSVQTHAGQLADQVQTTTQPASDLTSSTTSG